ncbi:hypothetical protein F3W83_15275, partial [Micrococcus luteus]|nr:hypothetical protein [Micrococcus luteus]
AGLLAPGAPPRILAADLHGAERAVSTALALLWARGADGDGGHATVALAEAAHALALPNRHRMTDPRSPLGGALPHYGVYPAAEGHVAVGALEPHFAAALVEGLGVDADGDVRAQLTEALSRHDAAHWPEQQEKLAEIRAALAEIVTPHVAEAWSRDEFPHEIARRVGELGYDHISGMTEDPLFRGHLMAELARADISLSVYFALHNDLVG